MTTVYKFYRVGKADYARPFRTCSAQIGMAAGLRAEWNLRLAVERGETPEVVLIAMERGCPAVIGPKGEVSNVWAFSDPDPKDPDHAAIVEGFAVGAFACAEIETDDYEPDHLDKDYADAGSVVVRRGRIVELVFAGWLDPVLDSIANSYAIPIGLSGQHLPLPVIEPQEPLLMKGILTPDECTQLVAAAMASPTEKSIFADHPDTTRPGFMKTESCSDPVLSAVDGIGAKLTDLVARSAQHFDLPVHRCYFQVNRYPAPADLGWHTDYVPSAPESWRRTLAFSLPLSRQGIDFEGGDFESSFGDVELAAGDAVSFTSRTRHRVRAVTSGVRYVAIGFGSHLR